MLKFFELFTEQNFILTKLLFQRGLAFIYFIGFLILFNQGKALIGENGLLPAKLFLGRIKFTQSPSLFFVNSSDTALMTMSGIGLFLSFLAMIGFTDRFGHLVSFFSWFFLWVIYLSFVNIGQTWYGYGWESMLLETGFLAIFLGPSNVAPPVVIIWLLRWVCFRNMFGAGMIKLRGDNCWKDLTCMYYFYETQPVPNPLSLFFHRLPKLIHKSSILFTYFAEIIAPLGILIPISFISAMAGVIIVIFQGLIILSGNLSWLNYISIILVIPCFNDDFLSKVFFLHPKEVSSPPQYQIWASYLLGLFICYRSIGPIINLFSDRQVMNRSFDPLHLVNTYGAFGSVTKERYELVVLGTKDEDPQTANWRAYEFKGKPTNPMRRPAFMSPYHWRLDWQMWFAAFGDYKYSPWTLNLIAKLLEGDREVLGLIDLDPFEGEKPKWIKIDYYQYYFQEPGKTGWWKRSYKGEWLPPLNFENESYLSILYDYGWRKRE